MLTDMSSASDITREGYARFLTSNPRLGEIKPIDAKMLLQELENFLNIAKPHMENKNLAITKIHSRTSHIAYAVVTLKDIFSTYEINERKHNRFIADVINAILIGADDSPMNEDRVRKQLEEKKTRRLS